MVDVIKVAAIETEAFRIESEFTSNIKIVLIPGNPGLIRFYSSYMRKIFNKLDGRYSIYGVAHAGQSELYLNNGTIYTLEDNINHKIQYLDDINKSCNNAAEFILLGHSVGAYISLQILRRRPDFKVHYVMCMFPALYEIYQGYTLLQRFTTNPYLRRFTCATFHFLPELLKDFILNKAGYDEFLSNKLLNYTFLQNILTMGWNEATTIRAFDDVIINKHIDKVQYLFTENDQYTHFYFDHFKQTFPKAKVDMAPKDVTHAFIIRDDNIEVVSEYTKDRLKAFFEQKPNGKK